MWKRAGDVPTPQADEILERFDVTEPTLQRQIVLQAFLDRINLEDAVNAACRIIEAADAVNLASDGPAGGLAPNMTFKEWKELYDVLDKARKGNGR